MSQLKNISKLRRSRLQNTKNKTAYLTIGRWQPPHKGHAVLINKTLDLALANNGHAYVYIYSKEPSRQDKWLANLSIEDFHKEVNSFKTKNPLDVGNILYYLQKMFPFKDNFTPDVFDFLLGERQHFRRYTPTHKDIRGTFVSPNRFGSMSLDLVQYLKKLKYKEVKIVVGSDRIEAFRKYNPNIEILQAGQERGDAGKGKLDRPVSPTGVEDLDDVGIVSFKLIKKNKFNANGLQKLERMLSDEVLFDPQPRPAIEISGSRMREYARTGNTRKFVEGSAIGNMTYQDCLQLMQDVREGMKLELKIRPRILDHIEIDPHDEQRGVITRGSDAEKDSEFFNDIEKFQIRGGKKNLLKKVTKTKKVRKTRRKRLKKNRKTRRKRLKKNLLKKVRKTKRKTKTIRKVIKVKSFNKTKKRKMKGSGVNMCAMLASGKEGRTWMKKFVKRKILKNEIDPVYDPYGNILFLVTAKKLANDYCKEAKGQNYSCYTSGECEKNNYENLSRRFADLNRSSEKKQ